MKSYIKSCKNYVLLIWLKFILLTMLTSDAKGLNQPIYSAVIDRIDHTFATILIEEIARQCTITAEKLPYIGDTLGQVWVNVIYDEENGTCEVVATDFVKTEKRKEHINRLQNKLRQRNE